MMTLDDKVKALNRKWGYAEVVKVTRVISGWQVWVVKNYAGKLLGRNHVMAKSGLPGNPRATKIIEYTSILRNEAIHRAYSLAVLKRKRKR